MAAVELGNYLTQTVDGEKRIKAMIVDDLDEARKQNDRDRVLALKLCLKNYLAHHANIS
jgi:hypothetical protein